MTVFIRLLNGVDPHIIDDIRHSVSHVPGVQGVTGIRARWSGHRLHSEIHLTAVLQDNLVSGHDVAMEAQHQLLHHLPQLASVTIHVDPVPVSGEEHHLLKEHTHDNLPPHSHMTSS
jgi:divalent metal cation (Fe/Co/Zn/Cd) transporter